MSRPLHQSAEAPAEEPVAQGVGRSTARALATAIALLMISLLVVTRSQSAFEGAPADADASFTTGDVTLSDDDRGTTLFDIPNMVPGVPVSECIAVTYDGDVVPLTVRLAASARGALAPALRVRIEDGTGGSFRNCGGFVPDGETFAGTLPALVEQGTIEAFAVDESPTTRTFRFTFELDPDVPVEGRATADANLEWTAEV